ncbi:putative RTA1 domain protein [Aspergillus thermomutatus]|uniref:Uncharacterized protein n=1 Tax=Aspergillus thermomutatus TaxID=41047 RepID=A0A397HWD9_ASPTH|nr:uncharacterized protein CDV56_107764 [Aspergillus thermomutatus]RHZ67332.1 hypothetical protein CDV56_107764 [Aspergillus thermomutatus]
MILTAQVPGSLYVYVPNKAAPIFFTIAFAASAIGHIWQCLRYKCIRMIGLHPFCAVLFTVGYAMQAYGAYGHYMYDSQNLLVYILSQVFIYICPPLLELANYHVLGRIFYYVPNLAPLPPGKVSAIFGSLMALVEALNAPGHAKHKHGIDLDPLHLPPGGTRGQHWYFYVFEASLMLLNSLLWNVFNPGRYLPRNHTVYLAADGTTEIEEEQVRDDQPVFVKAVYAAVNILTFGLCGLFARQKDEESHPLTQRNKYFRQT